MSKTEKFKIRYLRFSDAREAADIYNSSLPSLSRNEPISQEKMEELIKRNDKRFFIGLFLNKRLVGHLLLIVKDGKSKVLDIGIVIHPEYQGRGLGLLLLRKAVDIAKIKGYKKILAEILEYNNNSISFFKKNGFRIVGESDRRITKNGREVRLLKCEYSLNKAR